MGRIASSLGPRRPLGIGPLVVAAGFALMALLDPRGSYWTSVLPPLLVIATGMAGAVAPLTTAVLGAVDDRHTGTASGLNSAVARAGGLIATAAGTVLAVRGDALVAAFQASALVAALLAAIAGVTAWDPEIIAKLLNVNIISPTHPIRSSHVPAHALPVSSGAASGGTDGEYPMSRTFGRKLMLATVASCTLLLGACATETTYRPATGRGFNSQGYSERQVEQNRFLVSFAGNSSTPRDTVERYLLFRAAEITLQSGGSYFVMVNRDTDLQSRTYTTPGFGPGWGYGGFGGYWGPSWRYYGRGRGFGGYGGFGWSPWYGGGFGAFNDFDVETVQRYEATAEIIIGRGPIPRDNVRAFDARQVADRIGPTVVMPGQERRR